MELSEKIQRLRKARGLSQEELAHQMSVSRQSVSKWESAQSVPDVEKIIALSDYFGVSTDYLLKETAAEAAAPTVTPPVAKAAPSPTAALLTGTIVNLSALVLGCAAWYEYQNALSIAAELVLMLVGCGLFGALVQRCERGEKLAAIRQFVKVNVWVVFFAVASLGCNLVLLGLTAPYPIVFDPAELVIFLVVYFGGCAAIIQLAKGYTQE